MFSNESTMAVDVVHPGSTLSQVCAKTASSMDKLMGAHDGDLALLNIQPKLSPVHHICVQKVFKGVLDDLRVVNVNCLGCHLFSCRLPLPTHAIHYTPANTKILMLVFVFLSLVQVTVVSMSTSTFMVYALNANELTHPVKIHHFNTAIAAQKPHAFVVSESKTRSKVSKLLPSDDYDIYEELGELVENHHIAKWGVIVGVQKDLQVVQCLQIAQSALKGCVIALDIILPTMDG